MQCGIGIAFVSVGPSHYAVVANATLPQHVHVAHAHATLKALFVIMSISALASESSTANHIPDGVWRVSVSYSIRGPFLRLRVIPCSSSLSLLSSKLVSAAHSSGSVAVVSSESLLAISSSLAAVRYVRFQSRSAEGHFQVSYISVHIADDSNVASGKPVSVSASYAEGAPCGNVVKGKPEARNHPVRRLVVLHSHFASKSCIFVQGSWHGSSGQDWLEIDLLKEYAVVKVIFYNRKDCCHSRANNALLTLMDSSRNVVNTAVLNSDVVQTFTFTEIDNCSTTVLDWPPLHVPHSAVFVSDSVLAVLSQRGQSPDIDCPARLHLLHLTSPTSALWSGCVNVSLAREGALLYDREQRLFSLLSGDSLARFDANGLVSDSLQSGIGQFVCSNAAATLETDLAAVVARAGVYSHCNMFTGVCDSMVSQSECGARVAAAAHGLHAFLKCGNSNDVYSSSIAGCEANSGLAARLSGCVQQHSKFVSTMTLNEASHSEARWLWLISFHLDELFGALVDIQAQAPAPSQHATICAQVFGVLKFIDAARKAAWLLQSPTRKQLDVLGNQHSIFDTLSCTGAKQPVNNTAVAEIVGKLQRMHPWPHATVSL
jgi:hypothetical protein